MNMESQTTTSPIESSPEAARAFDPKQVLDLKELAALRSAQREAYAQSLSENIAKGLSDQDITARADETISHLINGYLKENSLTSTDDKFDGYKNALQNLSITAIPESDWYAKFEDEETQTLGRSGREEARRYYRELTGESLFGAVSTSADETLTPAGQEAAPEQSSDAESESKAELETLTEALTESLNESRTKLAKLGAKRQGNIFGRGDDYEEALDEYNKNVVALGRLETKALLEDESLSESEKNARVIEYLFIEQNALRDESMESLANSKVNKFIEKFAEFMNRGNTATRVAKGVLFGAGIAAGTAVVVGAGAGIAGVGAGIVASGIVAGAATRFARAFAMQDAKDATKNGKGVESLDASIKERAEERLNDADAEGSDDLFEKLQSTFDDSFEDDIKKEQKKRRKTVYIAAGSVAIGAALGTVVGVVSDSGILENLGGTAHAAPVPESYPAIDSLKDIVAGADSQVDALVNPPEIHFPTAEVPSFDTNFIVDSGEGGISFFQDLGLTESDWYASSQELVQNFPNDFYSDGGDVRISHPGQLSVEAQEFIKARFSL